MFKASLASLKQAGQMPSLDGLRALAILLVLMTHIAQSIPNLSFVSWNTEWATPLYNGWMGVDLFFVLSGFLIGSMLIKDLEAERFSLTGFYKRRFLRILPPYFFVIGLVLIGQKVFSASGALPPFSLKATLCSLLLLNDYQFTDLAIGNWSLAIEEHFYLLLPFFFILCRRTKTRIRLTLFVFLAALIFRMFTYRAYSLGEGAPLEVIKRLIYHPFHTRLDALAMGVLVALLKNSQEGSNKLFSLASLWLGLILVGFVFLTGELRGGFFNTTLQYSLISLGFGGLLWSVLEKNRPLLLQRFFALPLWTPVARISYSAYLLNILVIRTLIHFFALKLWMFPLMLALCLLAALPLYLFIEYPCHQLAKRKALLSPSTGKLIDTGILPQS